MNHFRGFFFFEIGHLFNFLSVNIQKIVIEKSISRGFILHKI